jgi:hypothetical protein
LGLQQLKFTLSGQNLWFITDYETFDPEVSEDEGNIDADVVPSNKMYSLILSATF